MCPVGVVFGPIRETCIVVLRLEVHAVGLMPGAVVRLGLELLYWRNIGCGCCGIPEAGVCEGSMGVHAHLWSGVV